ncbi:MAG TPA: universal stress protein [Archangium sp.]|uniref:universal stress protein n=1 Tax=Archangium sp. TaxID=1872627 RepID=UPI002E35DCF3|nr:universal stress protein [Archangium sp.]HEX5749502.1 universal stress protein [Archangium sp.]
MARILIAVDGSSPSQRALEFGASLAAKLGVGVLLLHAMPQVVLPLGPMTPGSLSELLHTLEGEGNRLLAALADKAHPYGVAVGTELGVGDAADVISERAEGADIQMVVMGSRGQGAVARLLLGSVATQVVHTATKPVVVVR